MITIDVQVDEDRLERPVGRQPERAEGSADAVGGEGPPAVGEVAGVGLRRPVQQERDDHEGDHPEGDPGGRRVRAVEARGAVLAFRGVAEADDAEDDERRPARRQAKKSSMKPTKAEWPMPGMAKFVWNRSP